MRPIRLSSREPPPPVYLSPHKSVALSLHPTASPSVIPACPSYEPSVNPPITLSMTRQSTTPPVSLAKHQSDRPSPSVTIRPSAHHPTTSVRHLPLSHRLYDAPISPSACPSPAVCLTSTTTHPPIHLSSPMIHRTQDSIHSIAVVNGEQSHTIHRTQDSSQSLTVVNGEQSRKAKKFHRAFTNYDLLLHALDASSIYLRDLRCVAPPKSGEDAHIACGKCDFGGATLNNPSLGCSYMLPRQWDPGGVSPSPNAPRDQSRTIAPSRYPYGPHTGYLVNLPYLQRWQDLHTSHVKLDIFIHGNITGLSIDMKKITGSINVIIPALTRPTPTNHECSSPYDRQSSRTNFTATATSYIRVTQNLK